MITIINEENITQFNNQQLETDAQTILNAMGYSDFSLNILLTNNATIQQYNRDYRSKDEPTDILSFPFHHNAQPNQKLQALHDDEKHIGDLIISLEFINAPGYAANESEKSEPQNINDLLRTLLCHGICHLLGYDHDTPETDTMMKEKETWLAKKLLLLIMIMLTTPSTYSLIELTVSYDFTKHMLDYEFTPKATLPDTEKVSLSLLTGAMTGFTKQCIRESIKRCSFTPEHEQALLEKAAQQIYNNNLKLKKALQQANNSKQSQHNLSQKTITKISNVKI